MHFAKQASDFGCLDDIQHRVMSGSDRETDQLRAYKLQVAAYLAKPADKDEYFATIRSILDKGTMVP